MAFKPGTPKPANSGRKKGTPNRVSLGVQTIIETSLKKTLPEAILEEIHKLDARDKVHVLLDLMNYCYPKRSSVNFGALSEEESQRLDALRKMSEDELRQIANGSTIS